MISNSSNAVIENYESLETEGFDLTTAQVSPRRIDVANLPAQYLPNQCYPLQEGQQVFYTTQVSESLNLNGRRMQLFFF